MIDIILLAGRLLFVALLYLFLFAIMRTGIGLVKGQRKKERSWGVSVEKGPKELRGVKMSVHGPIIVGRSPRKTQKYRPPNAMKAPASMAEMNMLRGLPFHRIR